MPFRGRRLLFAVGMLAWLGKLGGAEAILPPLEGELSGRFEAYAADGAPTLQWKLALRPNGTMRMAELTAEGAGTRFRTTAELDAEGNGTWQLHEAEVDLANWAAFVGKRMGAGFSELALAGRARLVGRGARRDGQWSGELYLSVRGGRIEAPEKQMVFEGVEVEFVIEDVSVMRSAPAQRISWTAGQYGEASFGAGRIMFTVEGTQVQVDEGVVALWGGEVILSAFAFSIRQPEVTTIARVVSVDLLYLMPMLDWVFSAAEGEIDGSIALHFGENGLSYGPGQLSLRADEKATLWLTPTPGIISSALPKQALQHYPGLGKIETGEVPLQAHRVDITLTPDGDAQGRSASVHIEGGPVDPRFRAPLDLTVNIRGPIQHLLEVGQRLEGFKFRSGSTPP